MPADPHEFPAALRPEIPRIPADSDAAAPVVWRFDFRGTAAEFFRIWMVNTLLTLATFGFFSPWAKVRTRRYFHGSAFLNGANFDYHASPWSILVARIIVVMVVVGGAFIAEENLLQAALHSTLLAFLLPWALVRGFAFNARYSSHRGGRFSFQKQTLAAYYIFAPILLFSVLLSCLELVAPSSLKDKTPAFSFISILFVASFIGYFIATPWILREWHDFTARNHSLGPVQFHFDKPPIRAYFAALWGTLIEGLVILAAIAYLLQFDIPRGVIAIAIFFAYLTLLFVFTFINALLFRIFWNHVRFSIGGESGKFKADFSLWEFAVKILVVNHFAIILSLGLLHPWAKIRRARFIARRLSLATTPAALDKIPGLRGENENAFGEEFEAAEGFDFDVGLV